jgi:hypothetical protein
MNTVRRTMKKANRLAAERAFVALAVLSLTFASPGTRFAQQPLPSKEREAIMRAKARMMTETLNQRASELGLVSVPDDEQAEFYRQRLERQLLEDLLKLDSVNAEKLAALDYKGLSEATADLKNRATRIRYNVPVLMAPGKIEKPRYDDNLDKLPSMLPELSRLINSFLGSPIFREASANDAELRAKAVRDLEGIIALSDKINKAAKRMNKVAAASR